MKWLFSHEKPHLQLQAPLIPRRGKSPSEREAISSIEYLRATSTFSASQR